MGDRAFTQGVSFLPQSTGADVIFRCLIALMYERVEWPESWVKKVVQIYEPLPQPARLLLQVHDELVFEAPKELIPEVRRVVTRVMSQPWRELDGLMLPVNFASGENWMEMEEAA